MDCCAGMLTGNEDEQAGRCHWCLKTPMITPYHGKAPDDMLAHIRSALIQVFEQILVSGQGLNLGTWQGIFLLEYRHHCCRRFVIVDLIGMKKTDPFRRRAIR